MSYLQRWIGSIAPEDLSGYAHFKVEGEDFSIPLPTFADAQRLDQLLDTAFAQGKEFAFKGVRRMVEQAMVDADRFHALTMHKKSAAAPSGA